MRYIQRNRLLNLSGLTQSKSLFLIHIVIKHKCSIVGFSCWHAGTQALSILWHLHLLKPQNLSFQPGDGKKTFVWPDLELLYVTFILIPEFRHMATHILHTLWNIAEICAQKVEEINFGAYLAIQWIHTHLPDIIHLSNAGISKPRSICQI